MNTRPRLDLSNLVCKTGGTHEQALDFSKAGVCFREAADMARGGHTAFTAEHRSSITTRLDEWATATRVVRDPAGLAGQPDPLIPRLADLRVRWLVQNDRREEAVQTAAWFERWSDLPARRYDAACLFALCAAGVPPDDRLVERVVELLATLQRAGDFSPSTLAHFRVDPDFANVREHPTFAKWVNTLPLSPAREQLPPPRKTE